ncbi:MAG: CDP-alcohol phosphatidyltransferase family protein [Anaerolineales bacterium]|nr:CDP-alcohol phosphatidyltransferase family protein [Anaerolineales bacterium]
MSQLKFRWAFYGLGSIAVLLLGAQLLYRIQGVRYASQWGLQAALVLAFQLVALWRALPQNHRAGEEEILPRFGPGNALSLARGTLIALLAGFLLLPTLPGGWSWLPFTLYILSDISDFLDGFAARISNMLTRLGESLDMNNDSLGVMVVTLLAFQYGRVPWWYLPFGFARFIYLFALHRHEKRGLPVYPLRPSHMRRWFAGIQMGFISVMLAPPVKPPATLYAATLFLIPFAGIFIYDYWQVTGKLDALKLDWEKIQGWLLDRMPFILRGLALLIYGNHALGLGLPLPLGADSASALQSAPESLLIGWNLLLGILLALGALGRFTPIAALISAGIRLQASPLLSGDYLLIFALVYLLFSGSGRRALWSPEDWLIYNRVGKPKP